MNWFIHFIGANNLSGPVYGFWSGFGSDIGQVVIIGGLISIYRKHNCHVRGCWRIARHPVEGTSYVVCRRHHPDGPPTHEHVLRLHREHKAAQAKAPPGQVAVDSPLLPDPRKLQRPGRRRP